MRIAPQLRPDFARALPQSVDAEARTVEVVWSTGADVPRTDRWTGERWIERLSLEPEHVDLSRLNSGAPVLDTHGRWELADQIGVVDRAWLDKEDGQPVGRAVLRFPAAEDDAAAHAIFRKIQDGIIRNISVGYALRKIEKVSEEDGVATMRAVDWQPFELSFVPVGADAGAGTREMARSRGWEPVEVEIVQSEGTDDMFKNRLLGSGAILRDKENEQGQQVREKEETRPASAEGNAGSDVRAEVERAVREERERSASIRQRCRAAGLEDVFADDLIGRGIAADHAGNHIIDELARRNGSESRNLAPSSPGPRVQGGLDARQKFVDGAERALLSRAGFGQEEGGNEFRGLTLRELAREALELQGVRTRGLGPLDLVGTAFTARPDQVLRAAGGMHTSSDFPLLLANVARKAMLNGLEEGEESFQQWTSIGTLGDYRPANRVALGAFPSLPKVGEGGEYTYGTLGETGETVQLAKYGRLFAITREAIINDDVDAFSKVPARMGRAALRTVGNLAYAALTSNPTMSDGKALFIAAHKNLATGSTSALSVASLSAARAALRMQADRTNAAAVLNITPRFLIVPVALESTARTLMDAQYDPSSATLMIPNPVRGMATVIADPRLDLVSTTAWYLTGSPSAVDTVEVSYLDGQATPSLEQQDGWKIDGTEFKVRMEAAAKALAWEGLYKSNGA